MVLQILTTNDLHGHLTPQTFPELLVARAECDLYLDGGDCIRTGNLGIPVREEPVWPLLAQAQCTASVPGNRESHVLEKAVEAKLAGRAHPLICCNWHRKSGEKLLPGSLTLTLDLAGEKARIGLIGVMVPMVTERMKTVALSQFLWSDPIKSVADEVETLRGKVDALFVLSHLGLTADRKLSESVDGIDHIFGAHSHHVLTEPEQVGKTTITQAGSHARFLARMSWEIGVGLRDYRLIPWKGEKTRP
jgi:5'-nucleotidase